MASKTFIDIASIVSPKLCLTDFALQTLPYFGYPIGQMTQIKDQEKMIRITIWYTCMCGKG